MARGRHLKALAAVAVTATAATGMALAPAQADTKPAAGTPGTVSADVLPTPQINGVVWDTEIVGNTVFAAGKFTKARPFGVPAGQKEQKRANILSFNIDTGKLTGFAPNVNGQIKVVTATPDGKYVLIGGSFTKVNGQPRYRVAAFEAATGKLTPLKVTIDARVNAIAVSGNTVYVGGGFSSVNGQPRQRLAAMTISGKLLPWQPKSRGGQVLGLAVSPDKSKVVAAGQFTHLAGARAGGWGAIHAKTGAALPWRAHPMMRNAGKHAGIYSLSANGQGVFVTGYNYGEGLPFEGVARARWSDGALTWVADCKGDSYDTAAVGSVVYYVSHNHDCEAIGGLPETEPKRYMRANALSLQPAGKNRGGEWAGLPAPKLLHWYPDVAAGNFTGQKQGAWTIESNGKYVIIGGEFPRVNGKSQYGLARFSVAGPKKQGPRAAGQLRLSAAAQGQDTKVTVSGIHDRDNATLTYTLMHGKKPVATKKVMGNVFYRAAAIDLVHKGGAAAGGEYHVVVTDPDGNTLRTPKARVGGGDVVGKPQPGQDPKPVRPITKPGKPGVVKPGEPIVIRPGEPIVVKPGEPIVVKPGKPIVVKPGEPIVVNPGNPVIDRPQQERPGGFWGQLFGGIFGGGSVTWWNPMTWFSGFGF